MHILGNRLASDCTTEIENVECSEIYVAYVERERCESNVNMNVFGNMV
jgi:hypothetical protein